MQKLHIDQAPVNHSPYDSSDAYQAALDQLTGFEAQIERRFTPWLRGKLRRGLTPEANPTREWIAKNFTTGCCEETVTRCFAKFERVGLFIITPRRRRRRGSNLKRQLPTRISLPYSAPCRAAAKPKPKRRATAEATTPPPDQQPIPENNKNATVIRRNKNISLKGGPSAIPKEGKEILARWMSRNTAGPPPESGHAGQGPGVRQENRVGKGKSTQKWD